MKRIHRAVCVACASGGGHQQPVTVADGSGEMKIQMAIVHPEIIVVEDAMTLDTNALILTVSLFELYLLGL